MSPLRAAILSVLVSSAGCALTARTPPPPPQRDGAITHRLVLLATADERSDDAAGAAVDVFGVTDTVIRTDEDLTAYFDRALPPRLAAEGIEVVENGGTTLELRVVQVELTREPGLVTARYLGVVDLVAVLTLAGVTHELRVVGEAQREGAGVRALEQAVFDELLAAALDDAARDAVEKVAPVVRTAPPIELAPWRRR